MGIPRKGGRSLAHKGKPYRYLVKSSRVEDHHDQKELVIVVQEDNDSPGNVLRFRACWGFPLQPSDVSAAITLGLAKGWNPSARGPAFEIEY